jgi:hypothetical protein
MELSTMVLLEQPEPSRAKVPPVVIVAPYAVHDALVADFAPGHSLAQTLAGTPIDPGAADSRITRALAAVPPTLVKSLVAMTGGRISGARPLPCGRST